MNLFGDSDYLEKLSSKGDTLERLEKVVDLGFIMQPYKKGL